MTPSKTRKRAPAPYKKKTTGATGKATAGAKKTTTTKMAKVPSKMKKKADAWDHDDEVLVAANEEEGKGIPKQSIEQIYQKKSIWSTFCCGPIPTWALSTGLFNGGNSLYSLY
ncbi:DNA topoisomerase 2-beta [Phytophthora pseudosyringae]|uniref:DNA topoisomerase 2-beta n=1 Tax=Phytophthora pseudosyringae TaxID=221518 RepID=A0A8T1VIY1_9STRA|nr:DNA topoisomerase 2-beta [Phytophthora pseudosyringae]